MTDYRLPSLGADMDKAELVEWFVHPGDAVRKGQVVALIETSKSVMDIEFFEDGVIEELIVPVGTSVEVGTPIARFTPAREAAVAPSITAPSITAPSVTAPSITAEAAPTPTPVPAPAVLAAPEPVPAVPAPAAGVAAVPVPAGVSPAAVSDGHRRIHPPASRLAEKLGVDLDTVAGSGPGGMVLRADVRAAAQRATGEPPPAAAPASRPEEAPGRVSAPMRPGPTVAPTVPASPRARHLAAEHGIDLSAVTGTGPDGVVSGEDVERFVEASAGRVVAAAQAEAPAPSAPPAAAGEPATTVEPPPAAEPAAAGAPVTEVDRAKARRLAMRKAIADLMARSKREIPHYYLDLTIDMTRSLEWLEAENLTRPMPQRLLPAVLFIKAVARAAGEVPEMNGFWVDDRFQPSAAVHAGVAISLREGGLIAPAIHDAEKKDLDQLMEALRDLVTRTRAGILHRPEMTDPTITITNLGDQGVDAVYGVIYPPQVALVGFGRIVERPFAEDGMLGVRRVVKATLAADHRATDGHRGGIFLKAIDRWLQEPEKL